MNFAGKNILVVGGSSGIGLSVVTQLNDFGASVFSLSRSPSPQLPPGVKHIAMDVLHDVSTLGESLPEKLHGVVYSVGSINLKPFARLTEDDFMHDYRLNVLGAVKILQQALKPLKNAQGASVVLISSVAAQTGMGFHASIGSAKADVEGLTKSLAAEFAGQHIRVNAVGPSITDTPMAKGLLGSPEKKEASAKRHPVGRIGAASDIGSAIVFLLGDGSSWVTGQVIGIDGGFGKIR